MTIVNSAEVPSFRKHSKAKIWLRTGILAIFAVTFGISLYHDIASHRFLWYWGLITYLICFPIGFAMRNLEPMQARLTSKHITIRNSRYRRSESLDRRLWPVVWPSKPQTAPTKASSPDTFGIPASPLGA